MDMTRNGAIGSVALWGLYGYSKGISKRFLLRSRDGPSTVRFYQWTDPVFGERHSCRKHLFRICRGVVSLYAHAF